MELNLNRTEEITPEQLDDIFYFKPWDQDKITKGTRVRAVLQEAFAQIIENVPPCPDRSAALRKLREVRMDCNSAISHDGKY